MTKTGHLRHEYCGAPNLLFVLRMLLIRDRFIEKIHDHNRSNQVFT
jgi:hypothetical protein